MPTAARLVAAILLAMASASMYLVFLTQYPDERLYRYQPEFPAMLGVLGAIIGWWSLGKKVKFDPGLGVALGLRAAITVAFWGLLVVAMRYSVERMIGHAYWDPTAAILDMLAKMMFYAGYLLNWTVLSIAAVLGIIVGNMTVGASRRWN